MAAGGTDEGPPGIRENYNANYYGAFVRDLDGNKIEAVTFTAPEKVSVCKVKNLASETRDTDLPNVGWAVAGLTNA